MKKLLFSVFLLLSAGLLNGQSLFSDSVNLNSVTIEAQRTREESPTSHQKILDSAMLSNPSSGNLGKLISENTGIFVKSYGQGALASVSFRGSGASHTGVYWNGFALNSAMNGMVDLSLLPIAFYDQVEIDYGNSSIEKGAGGLGGSIDLRSFPDFGKPLSLDMHQSIGSFGHLGSYARIGFGNNKWQSETKFYSQSAENDFEFHNLGKEGFPIEKQENANFDQKGFLQSIYFRPNQNKLIKLEAWYVNSERELPSIMTVNNKDEKQIDESIRMLASIKNYFKNGKMEFASNYQHEFLDYSNKMLEQHSKTITNSWKNHFKTDYRLSRKLTFQSKLQMDLQKIDNDVYKSGENQWRQAMYLAGQYELKEMDMELFVREEWLSGQGIFLLPGAGIRYVFGTNENLVLGANIAKNMKFPTLNDLYWVPAGNPNLKAETSTNLELQFSTSSLKLSNQIYSGFAFTVYRYDIQNYIQWQPTAFGYWRAENLKEIESNGLEMEGELYWKFGQYTLMARASYSYTRSINTKALQEDDESVGKQLFYVPEHLWNLHLELKRKDHWLKLSQHYTGLRYTASDNSDFLPSFTLVAAELGKSWKLNGHLWSMEFRLDNLLNEDYQAIQWRPMPGRSYLASIKYHFQK